MTPPPPRDEALVYAVEHQLDRDAYAAADYAAYDASLDEIDDEAVARTIAIIEASHGRRG